MLISFKLNGNEVQVDSAPDRRVIDLLREDLGLTGTKESCGRGDCGACSILIDGDQRLSCLMLAVQLEGREMITIEGFSLQEDRLSNVQQKFIELGAAQCGFCTPGMVISATALLRVNPEPSRSEVRQAISGNLCRCGAYQKILDAIEAASKEKTKL
ncbi:MAG: (2Fe-2S)-binding protein [Deltaproteobacteria bacterium]|nr:(2Fe-2S)-binding protein [Deltaproteobacteria bacterium]